MLRYIICKSETTKNNHLMLKYVMRRYVPKQVNIYAAYT